MIRAISFTSEEKINKDIPIDDFAQILTDPNSLLWVDLSGEPTKKIETILKDTFNFHQLSIDDALMETHVPRVDDWDAYVYLVLRSVTTTEGEDIQIGIPELDIFLGPNFLVTYHSDHINEIETLWKLCNRDERYLKKGAANLFYHLADEMVNQYMPAIEQMNEVIDQIEDDIIDHPKTEMLSQIFKLKRTMLMLRRTLLPQREVFSKLARGDFEVIHDQSRVYFRDIYDHMVRLEEINESLRDLVSGALDT
ncbi:MAG: magnesium transporter CorA family protein, partial [Pelolinea sp.]|nr:magnesium transporter CorA family protein [Pelolinea sp.]